MFKLRLAAFLLFVFVVALGAIFIYLLAPHDKEVLEKVDFQVKEGQRSAEIAQSLNQERLIKNDFAFYVYLKLIGGKILPGIYELSPSQSGSEIAAILATGRFKVTRITIIEGWRAGQMEKYLVEEKRLKQMVGFTEAAERYEGYLFPDTYEIKVDTTIDELIKLMRDNFDKRTKDLEVTAETVILASIIEREAQTDAERPLIAGVYANRIRIGMRLEADPTVQYAKGDWVIINRSDYRNTISPYNTYLNDGLPPGPICSPGLKSLEAAANPASHDYIFFFHAKGEIFFSKTLAEHEAKVRQNF